MVWLHLKGILFIVNPLVACTIVTVTFVGCGQSIIGCVTVTLKSVNPPVACTIARCVMVTLLSVNPLVACQLCQCDFTTC